MNRANEQKQLFSDLSSVLEDYLRMILELRVEVAVLQKSLEQGDADFAKRFEDNRKEVERATAQQGDATLRRILGTLGKLRTAQ